MRHLAFILAAVVVTTSPVLAQSPTVPVSPQVSGQSTSAQTEAIRKQMEDRAEAAKREAAEKEKAETKDKDAAPVKPPVAGK